MTDTPPAQPAGWYHAQGDPPGTHRYWDGSQWQGGPQPVAGPAAPAVDAAGDLASPGQRLLARVIDWVWWVLISVAAAVVIGGGQATVGTDGVGRRWVAGVVGTLVIAAVEVWFTSTKGGTPGKLVVGLRVARAGTREFPIDTRSAGMRVLPFVVQVVPVIGALITFVVGVISIILIFTDAQRQAIWDKLAGTVVVRAAGRS